MHIFAFAPVAGYHILTWLVIGLVAGVLASLVVRGTGMGIVHDVLIGLAGAVIGGVLLHAFRGGRNVAPTVGWEIVVAFIGAVLLLLVVRARHRGGVRRRRSLL